MLFFRVDIMHIRILQMPIDLTLPMGIQERCDEQLSPLKYFGIYYIPLTFY